MSSAVNSVMQDISNPLQAIESLASAAFPEASCAVSLGNMMLGVVGGAVNGAAQQLNQQSGMPSGLLGIIEQVVNQVLGQQTQQSDPSCDQACQNDFGQDFQQLGQDLQSAITDGAKLQQDSQNPFGGLSSILDSMHLSQDIQKLVQDIKGLVQDASQGGGQSAGTNGSNGTGGSNGSSGAGGSNGADGSNGTNGNNPWDPSNYGQVDDGNGTPAKGKGGGGNWLVAIAKAMGNVMGQYAQKLNSESQQIANSSGNAQQMNQLQATFQADSQVYSMISNAFSNAIKSIGQGLQTMASKQ